jgi:flagellar hook-length control protein FliK
LQAEQALRVHSEDELFAQVFARELSKSLMATAASQPRLSSTGGVPPAAVDKDSANVDNAVEQPLVQSNPLPEPAFQHVAELDEPIDFYQEEAAVFSDRLNFTGTPHTVIQDDIFDSVMPDFAPTASVRDEGLVPAMAQPFSIPLPFDALGRPVSSELAVDMTRGATVQEHPPLQRLSLQHAMSQFFPPLLGQVRLNAVQAGQINASLIQAPPNSADQMLFEVVPADALLAAPSDVAVSVGGGRPKEYTQTGAVMPSVAKGPVEQIQAAPVSQETALIKLVTQDKINVNLPLPPLQSVPHPQPGLHVAAPLLPQPILNEPNFADKNPVKLVQDWPATQPFAPAVQTMSTLATERDQLAGADYAPTFSLQTGGTGRVDGLSPQPDPQRPELPRATVQQLVDASLRATERPVELVLNPEDLGRVRISMSMTDASVTLNMGAERSETLELLRRYSEVLAQELRDLGYGKISFSFGHHGNGHGAHPESVEAAKVTANEPLAPVVVHATSRPVQTGLDIRL